MQATYPLVISITSGKGGVGKTNVSVNLAAALARESRVILMDADLGLANVDVLLGITPAKSLFSLFTEQCELKDILFPTPYGFDILPTSSGMDSMVDLSTGQKLELLDSMNTIAEGLDYLIVDTGAGINDHVLYFNSAAQERLLIVTTDPTSVADAYALIKVLKLDHGIEHFHICLNMATSQQAARETFIRLSEACDHFLTGVSLDLAAIIPMDPAVRAAVMQQKPFIMQSPSSQASKAIEKIAARTGSWRSGHNNDGNIKFFWQRILYR